MGDLERLTREEELERDLLRELERHKKIKNKKVMGRDKEILEIIEEDPSLDKVGELIKKEPVKRGILRSRSGHKIIDFKNIEIFFKDIAKPADIAAVLWYGQAYYASMGKQLKGRGQINFGMYAAIIIGVTVGIAAIMYVARKFM